MPEKEKFKTDQKEQRLELPPLRSFFGERQPTVEDLEEMKRWIEWRSTKHKNPALRRWSLPIREESGRVVENPSEFVAKHIHELGDLKDKKILCFGSGLGRDALYLLRRGAEVTIFDPSEDALNFVHTWAHKWGLKGKLHIGGTFEDFVNRFQLRGEEFDAVISVDSFHHLKRPGGAERFFEHIQNRTKPNGIHIIQAYNSEDSVLRMDPELKLEEDPNTGQPRERYAPKGSELRNHYIREYGHMIGNWKELHFEEDLQRLWSYKPDITRHSSVIVTRRLR